VTARKALNRADRQQPIPTWILLASLPFLYRAVSSSPRPKTKPAVRRWLAILQLLFAFALVAMQILEITRLALANEGVGLLPAVLVGLLIAAVLIGIRTGLWSRTGSSALLAISTCVRTVCAVLPPLRSCTARYAPSGFSPSFSRPSGSACLRGSAIPV
jgi:hypothetical protein